MGSFEDDISDLFSEHDNVEKARNRAQEREDEDLQVFLSSFRDKLASIIIPRFNSAAVHPSAKSRLSVVPASRHSVFLKAKTGDTERRLTFSVDHRMKRILITKRETPHRVITLEEVTEEMVHEEVKTFLLEAFPARL